MLLSWSADIFKIKVFIKFFQEHYQSIKRFRTSSEVQIRNVGPDLGPNSLQNLSAGDKSCG